MEPCDEGIDTCVVSYAINSRVLNRKPEFQLLNITTLNFRKISFINLSFKLPTHNTVSHGATSCTH